MKKRFVRGGAAAFALALFASTGSAHAVPAEANGGFDDIPNHIRGGGSDTTYEVMQRLETLYNGSPGCGLNNPASLCTVPGQVTTENYDHDTVVGEYPTGSSAGVSKIATEITADPNSPFRYARSSRPRGGSDNANTVFSGYAKDGLAIVAFNGFGVDPTTRKISPDDVKRIFFGSSITGNDPLTGLPWACATNWSQIINPDTNAPYPAKPIKAYGVQTASGTSASLRTSLGLSGSANQNKCSEDLENACVTAGNIALAPLQIPGGTLAQKCERQLFENNTAPLDGGTGTDGFTYTAAALDRADAVWWMSNGPRLVDAVATGTAKPFLMKNFAGNYNLPLPGTVGAAATDPNTYALSRVLFHVTWNSDHAAAGGVQGASRAFHEWICRQFRPSDVLDGVPYTVQGNNSHNLTPKRYYAEITNAIAQSGFVRIPIADSTKLAGPDNTPGNADDIQTRCFLDGYPTNVLPGL